MPRALVKETMLTFFIALVIFPADYWFYFEGLRISTCPTPSTTAGFYRCLWQDTAIVVAGADSEDRRLLVGGSKTTHCCAIATADRAATTVVLCTAMCVVADATDDHMNTG